MKYLLSEDSPSPHAIGALEVLSRFCLNLSARHRFICDSSGASGLIPQNSART